MKILFTNNVLNFAAGTQVIVRDLAIALQKRGMEVAVFTLHAGPFAEEIRKHGITVSEHLSEIPFVPDIIHAHHYRPALEAMEFFSDTPAISFIHDRLAPIDIPPRHRRIMQYLASDYNVYDRIVKDAAIPAQYVSVLLNWVDTSRFPVRDTWNEHPQRALVFSNYASEDNFFAAIRKACEKTGIPLDVIGKQMGNPVSEPGPLLCKYDIVFAKAKAAMEALATGAVVIACDKFGLGEMVTTQNYAHYRQFNFGMKILNRPVKPSIVMEEIRKYNTEKSKMLAEAIRRDADFERYVDTLTDYYSEAIRRYHEGFQTYHKSVFFNPLSYWVRRKLISRKRELQKQVRRLKRHLRYG